jgi:BirA family biotin operon repressor/biotin-[acetyl-CoA-carboxylase] ligase
MPTTPELIRLMADGKLHSGTELAEILGCSRTAVWKHLQSLDELGLAMTAVPGRGYQLDEPIELLEPARIRQSLDAPVLDRLEALTVESITDSTSEALRRAPSPAPGRVRVAMAEFQRGGRGRRGRGWLSPFASGLCLSASWTMDPGPAGFAGLSLALGVSAQTALAAVGANGVGLKWPNDLVVNGAKLGGLLLDLEGEAGGPMKVVAGIGINVRRNAGLHAAVHRDDALVPAFLDDCCPSHPSRNTLAAGLISAFCDALARFERNGFEPFADAWRRLDALQGKAVRITVGNRVWEGEARGIAPDGALLVARDGELEAVMSGDVSVRTTA